MSNILKPTYCQTQCYAHFQSKVCTKCRTEKDLNLFIKRKQAKDGHRNICTDCNKEYAANYREQNRERYNELSRKWRQLNPEKVREQNKKYIGSEIKKACTKRWIENNPERIKELRKKTYQNRCEKVKAAAKEYRIKNQQDISKKAKEKYQLNPELIKNKNNRSYKKHAHKRKAESKEYSSLNREIIGDVYVKTLLHSQSKFELSAKDFDINLINIKRQSLKLKRILKNKKS